jgi:hypothetical protein
MSDHSDHELLEEMNRNMAVMASEFKASCKRLEEVCSDMYGNGKTGVKDDVSTLKTKMGGIQWMGSLLGGAAITGAVAGIWALLKGKQ